MNSIRDTQIACGHDYDVRSVLRSQGHLSEVVTIQLRSKDTEGMTERENLVGRRYCERSSPRKRGELSLHTEKKLDCLEPGRDRPC